LTHEELLLFGERLRNRRNQLAFTQEYVAEKIGISLRFYQMIERGEKSVSLDTLIRLSRTLTISIDYLLFGTVTAHESPIAEIINSLSPRQREDACQILRLYADASKQR
jgi:transcriptional regulator with XRE-family HTH domain